MNVVYAMSTSQVETPDGGRHTVRAGSHWPDSDPVVKARPDMFSTDGRFGLSFSTPPPGMDEPPVEQATAAPGERRGRVQRG
jgi:hypothetical protein